MVDVTPGKGNLPTPPPVKRPAYTSDERTPSDDRQRQLDRLALDQRIPGTRERWESDQPYKSANDYVSEAEEQLAEAEVDADASSRALSDICE